jgi:tRNA dimethylallyltransferase
MKLRKPLIVVLGPTASGKSELAVQIAKKVDGEIISADSRQIYKGFDISAGKVDGQWKKIRQDEKTKNVFIYKNVSHHLIDEASPKVQYSVARFQKNARAAIDDILRRGKTPIICGGTGHWIDAVIFDQTIPTVKADAKLRAKLNKLTTEQLHVKLLKLDPVRAASIDAHNPRRLIRALEIVLTSGQPVPKISKPKYFYKDLKIEWIGINPPQELLEKKIRTRLSARLKEGMVEEITALRRSGLSWKKLEGFGLEYKYCALYLQNKISAEEMESQLYTAIRQYAKRQMTWWKRNQDIQWLSKPSLPIALVKTA